MHQVQNLLRTLQVFSASNASLVIRWQQSLGHMTSLEKLTLRSCLHMRPVVCSSQQLQPISGSLLHPSRRDTGSTSDTRVVGTALSSSTGSPPANPPPQTSAIYRRLDGGMESPSDHSPDFRLVEHFTESSPHQQPRTAGSTSRSTTLPASGDRQFYSGDDGQHDNGTWAR